MNNWKPTRLGAITQQTIGNETMLLDAKGGAVHVLNTTALVIWQLCDGEHTEREIVSALRDQFDLQGVDTIEGDVSQTLRLLADKGLLS